MDTQTIPPMNPAKNINLPADAAARIARQIAETAGVVTVLGGLMEAPR